MQVDHTTPHTYQYALQLHQKYNISSTVCDSNVFIFNKHQRCLQVQSTPDFTHCCSKAFKEETTQTDVSSLDWNWFFVKSCNGETLTSTSRHWEACKKSWAVIPKGEPTAIFGSVKDLILGERGRGEDWITADIFSVDWAGARVAAVHFMTKVVFSTKV